jgi:hypothetical protein
VKPIPATIEAVNLIGRTDTEGDLLEALESIGDQVQRIVPDCVGLSLAWTEYGVTFTLAASEAEIAVFDGLQYLDSGPCVDAVRAGHGIEASQEDLLDESSWRLFAQAVAAAGVRTTITFPLASHGSVVGSANFYGASDNAFEGHQEALARIVGGWAPGAVLNADLSFSTRRLAEQAPETLKTEAMLDRAIAFIASKLRIDLPAARERLRNAARRAGISELQLAEALIRLRP